MQTLSTMDPCKIKKVAYLHSMQGKIKSNSVRGSVSAAKNSGSSQLHSVNQFYTAESTIRSTCNLPLCSRWPHSTTAIPSLAIIPHVQYAEVYIVIGLYLRQ